ncbi:MAG: PD-(D/E)XK nuclease family protein [Vicinamibacterales bacterium]
MITPRRTRLLRVPSLAALRATLTEMVGGLDPVSAADTFVIVPTRAAGEQLRRSIEGRLLGADRRAAFAWPMVGPRADWYRELCERAAAPLDVLGAFDREVILGRLARQTASGGLAPPFAIRPGLVAEMLMLYDYIRRQDRLVDDFDRNLRAELEPSVDTDRGAARLVEQTAFLTASFAGYEAHLQAHGLLDEHAARQRLVAGTPSRPLRHAVVTVADRVADADGLWPVDFTLLSTLPGLERVDVVATESMLAAGLLERMHAALPEIEEVRHTAAGGYEAPVLVTPAGDALVHPSRDREEELADAARRIKRAVRAADAPLLHRHALVVRRPLPYLYLARAVFGSAGVPFEALDTLPLAAEPFAAALDLVLDAVSSDFSRDALTALLRSPHFRFEDEGAELDAESIDALDRSLADVRYLGGQDRLARTSAEWSSATDPSTREERRRQRAAPAARVATRMASELSPLASPAPVVAQLATVQGFLERYHREVPDADALARGVRVRRAVLGALGALGRAYARHDPDATASGLELSSAIRRWLGAQTFAARTGASGLRVLDAQAARFADLDDVQLMGLVEGEWPEPARRSIFYPASLLALLEPTPAATDPNRRDSDRMAAARAEFFDLLHLAGRRVRVSAFALESDAVVEPSPLIDELGAAGLARQEAPPQGRIAVFADEALLMEPPEVGALPPAVVDWVHLRAANASNRPHAGQAGPWTMARVSVSRVDRYLKCPFQFFASEVLRLEEEPRDEDAPPPWERGRFLHALFETFFREWQDRGYRTITADRVPEARDLLSEVAERALATLSAGEAALERLRLFGSATGAGIIDRVLAMEAERPDPVERRLIEYELDDPFEFRTPDGGTRALRLRAKIDRVDLLGGGAFRVIDYKSKTVPDPRRSVQLQVYTSAVGQQLARQGLRDARPSEAFYLSMEGEPPIRALRPARGESLDDVLRAAEGRMVEALDDIAAGCFPVRPALRSLCGFCPFDPVCRKAYDEDDGGE